MQNSLKDNSENIRAQHNKIKLNVSKSEDKFNNNVDTKLRELDSVVDSKLN